MKLRLNFVKCIGLNNVKKWKFVYDSKVFFSKDCARVYHKIVKFAKNVLQSTEIWFLGKEKKEDVSHPSYDTVKPVIGILENNIIPIPRDIIMTITFSIGENQS